MTQKLLLAVIGTAMALGAASHQDYKVEDREPVSHTFTGDKTIDVDLVNGSVTVIGDGAGTIRVQGERVIRAASQDQVARAKKDDLLDINEKDGVAQLYENGPFRNNNGHSSDDHGFHDTSERQYEVAWNLTVHVPRETALKLRSVNGGVSAQDTSGAFDVRSVNGALSMTNISGSGAASAVNGTNTVSFRENPKADSAFTSVNGKIEMTFQPNLSADFTLRTVNGGMYTDFESTALATTGAPTKDNGRFVYRMRGESRIRVGAGGPQIRIETVNGSIQIRKQTK
jgi:DUF4097 and DUF4098 domain-containing protein YvlB